jgi:excisionase family DNA binding protein
MKNDNAQMHLAVLHIEDVKDIARAAYEAGRTASTVPEKMMNAKGCAAFLGLSTGTVYTLAANGEIPCRKIGDRYIFHPGEVAAWVANRLK